MSDSLLRLDEVKRRTGYSVSGLYEAMARGDFPRPLKRGAVSLWVESEVQAVIDADIKRLPRMGPSMGARAPRKKKPLQSAA